ncbi:MAG: ATP-dependent zinc metalloprotease FtsH [Firmicutes bacterium]|nr:ATP-dependent zinc metalloprotease FtsH [Bacillota bacterium]
MAQIRAGWHGSWPPPRCVALEISICYNENLNGLGLVLAGARGGLWLNRFLRGISLYILLAVVVIMVVSGLFQQTEPPKPLDYSAFTRSVDQGKVDRVVFIGAETLDGVLKDGTHFTVILPPGVDEQLTKQLQAHGVLISAQRPPQPSWWMSFLPNLILLVAFVGLWLFFLNQMQGGGNRAMSFGKSRAKLHAEDKPRVTFNDVAGVDEAKQELAEVVDFLKHPKRFAELGAKIPKGVLLVGPPGTGKTLLARAIAGEAGVPFFSISGSDFVEMFVGVGAARVRDLFDTAKKHAPCIVFIDEIDAVGRQRGAGLGGGHDEREQTLNQLLVEMDGFEPNAGIIILAATNRPDVLDPALLRPGRFDRQVVVDRPDVNGREEILKIHARGKPLAEDVDLKVLARRTPGFTGADLENLMNEAAILAARRSKKRISMQECEEAIDRVMMGPERKKRVISPREKEVFAYHEAGHAVVAHYSPHIDPVHKVTIIPRGMAGGYTMVVPVEDKHLTTKTELMEYLSFALGGRAAEEITFGEISTGAQNDLEQATRMVRKMITEYGMSERLGPMTFGHGHEEQVFLGRDITRDRNYSEEVAAAIDREARAFIDRAYHRAKEILFEHQEELKRVVEALKEQETLTGEEFRALMGPRPQVMEPGPSREETAEEAGEAKPAAAATRPDTGDRRGPALPKSGPAPGYAPEPG